MAGIKNNARLDHPHYSLIFTDKDGTTHKQFSPSLVRDGPSIISDETTSHFLATVARYRRPKCDEQDRKRRRIASTATCRIPSPATSNLMREDDKSLRSYYEKAFEKFQQTNCRVLAKAYIKLIEPRKQMKYPYNGRVSTADGTKQLDPEVTKPPWWPSSIIHREPDHLLKDRIQLLVSILCDLHTSHIVTVEKLRKADQAIRRHISAPERLQILDELYRVRGKEEKTLKSQWPRGDSFQYNLERMECSFSVDSYIDVAFPEFQSPRHSTSSAPKDHKPFYYDFLRQCHDYPHRHDNFVHANFLQRMDCTVDPSSPSNEALQQNLFSLLIIFQKEDQSSLLAYGTNCRQ